ncbi:MAG: class I SAM-dependent methyltransferase [Acidobacteriota bacterium]|nr:class I SAM-dependent methyltransferase [Acidobacteriota bacterium]
MILPKIEVSGESIFICNDETGDGREKNLIETKEEQLALKVASASCCLCDTIDAETLGTGEDFEYRTSPDEFSAMRCRACGLVYLSPRPDVSEFARIYPSNYHAFEFSPEEFGFVFKVRRRLEARHLLSWCRNLPLDARIIDIGCGDGFHLELLRDFGKKSWTLEGVDADERAALTAEKKGLKIHCGLLENLDLPEKSYDLAFLIMTVEHVADPPKLLRDVRSILKPGGRVVIVTDNTDSLDFRLFKKRHWGGYHFPRHWNLFNPATMRRLAEKTEMEVESLTTQVSPVNWVYSIRNLLVDRKAPAWLVERFSLKSPLSLGVFTIFDILPNLMGRGALLNAILKRPS